MRIIHEHVAGLDVHKKTVVAATLVKDATGAWQQARRTFGTMTQDLLALSDWLLEQGVTHVAMESTGDYWKPIFNILESNFEVLLANAQHLSRVPGRKTDESDAEWIAECMQCGLLKPSFIPPPGQRELRELTRYRTTFVRERASLVNRVQKVLEGANIKLASVASDVVGVSGRAMLAALIEGQASPEEMAELAKGALRAKRDLLAQALEGRVKAHHRFVLTELLCQVDSLDETIARFDGQIEEACRPFEEAIVILDTLPGVARETAQRMAAEMGIDMSRFPTADHLSAWAGAAPGNKQSAGKRYSGRRRKGNQPLLTVMMQAAWSAIRAKDNYFRSLYYHLVRRLGSQKAILAVAHAMLVAAYHMLKKHEPYRELGADYFDEQNPKAKEAKAKRLVKQLKRLGYQVSALNSEAPAPATA